MNLSTATKAQLYQIATDEPCEIDMKYAAARELQRRENKIRDWMIEDIFRLFPRHETPEIAEKIGIDYRILNLKLHGFGLRKKVEDI